MDYPKNELSINEDCRRCENYLWDVCWGDCNPCEFYHPVDIYQEYFDISG